MSLARIFPTIGSLIVRKLGDDGGPSSDRVSQELNNIIAWAKNSPRNIVRDTSTVNSVGAGETNLHNISIAAGTLATNGDYLSGEGGGAFAGNANTKTVRFKVDGTVQAAIVLADGTQGWILRYKVIRLTSTSVRVNCTLEANVLQISKTPGAVITTSTGYAFQGNNTDEAVSDLAANALAILVTGQGTANNDITQTLSIVELTQQ